MSPFTRYGRKDLAPADHIALAAALTTIHLEGMEEPPLNSKWDDSWRNEYSVRFIAQTPSFIIINASEGMRDDRDRFKIFSLNTYRQAVIWEAGPQASNVTPVPKHLRPFFQQLTDTVHDLASKRAEALELERGEEDEIDAKRRELKSRNKEASKEEEKERVKKAAEEKWKRKLLRRKLLRRKDELDQERNKRKMEKEKKREREEILSRKNELRDRELKRRKMKEGIERKEKVTEQDLEEQISRRKDELDHALLAMNMKAFATELAFTPAAKLPSDTDKMLEMATRGPEHDLCEGCGATLRFCADEECTIIGCDECFCEDLKVCEFCDSFACAKHFKYCSMCEALVCVLCEIRQVCESCGEFKCEPCRDSDEAVCGLCTWPMEELEAIWKDYMGSTPEQPPQIEAR